MSAAKAIVGCLRALSVPQLVHAVPTGADHGTSVPSLHAVFARLLRVQVHPVVRAPRDAWPPERQHG